MSRIGRQMQARKRAYRVKMIIVCLATGLFLALYIPALLSALGSVATVRTGAAQVSGQQSAAKSGEVLVPTLNLALPLFPKTNEKTLSLGATLWRSQNQMSGTTGTRPVITAHSGVTNHQGFDRLDELQTGDHFVVSWAGKRTTYAVIKKEVVKPQAVRKTQPRAGQALATLVTCTPYMVNTHRLLVTGKRVRTGGEKAAVQVHQVYTTNRRRLLRLIIIGMSGVILFGMIVATLSWQMKKGGGSHESKH
ncbi:class C sortase [Schleiferilactobacillus perolens]|jgi:sortase A|uniref:class C sortase n=1 Tax=Schleiferilactobacillus perolens TaxID=100468 RepID=UPI002354266F|nr:class C sortase [Schleiferilactobacillus perolens]MCI2172130.1 class C sortase [Schleiferilactobacillus perolens]